MFEYLILFIAVLLVNTFIVIFLVRQIIRLNKGWLNYSYKINVMWIKSFNDLNNNLSKEVRDLQDIFRRLYDMPILPCQEGEGEEEDLDGTGSRN